MRRRWPSTSLARVSCAVALVAGVASCSGQQPPPQTPQACKPQTVGLTVIAARSINPSDDGEPRPVQLRIYELKADARLLDSSFESVWKADKATLMDDLVKVDEFAVYPDSRTEAKFERDESAHFVAAVALFRNPKGRSWWTEFELAAPTPSGPCLPANVNFAVWIDQSRVTDGSDHLDEHPNGGRVRELHLHFAPASAREGEQGPPPPPPAPGGQQP